MALKLRLAIIMLLCAAATSCGGSARGVPEGELDLQYSDRYVIPSFARTKTGNRFTGSAYGTFFGETRLDCVEWEGPFKDGRPHGSFKVYSSCNALKFVVLFNHGAKVKVRPN